MLKLPVQLQKDGTDVLGIPIGSGKKEFALTKLTAQGQGQGWIVGEEDIHPWTIQGAYEVEGQIYLYGPFVEGIFLEQLLQQNLKDTLFRFVGLVKAMCLLKARGISLPQLQTDSVYFLNSGEILFLPPEVLHRALELRPLDYRLGVYERINHPDLRGMEEQLSFSVAVILYRLITERFPFEADSDEETRNRIRHYNVTDPRLLVPRLKTEAAAAIMQSLNPQEQKPLDLEIWRTMLAGWLKEGLFQDIPEAEQKELEQEGIRLSEKAAQSYQRSQYWRKNWKTVGLISAGALLVLILGGSYVRRLLEPPATRGFPPQKIVETFYQSMNTLDHGMMEDCVTDKAGKENISEIINLFVLTRVAMGYEGRSNIVSADEWDKSGRPPLEAPQSVFGVTGLQIEELAPEPEPVYRVRYEKWYPLGGEDPLDQDAPSGPGFEGTRYTDTVYVRWEKKDWLIYRIERIPGPTIDPSGSAG